jgi:hypothetical protein
MPLKANGMDNSDLPSDPSTAIGDEAAGLGIRLD